MAIPVPALASGLDESFTPSDYEQVSARMAAVQRGLLTNAPEAPCLTGKTDCAALQKNVCKATWSDENRGNYVLPAGQGELKLGDFPGTSLLWRDYVDAAAIRDSFSTSFPVDAKGAAKSDVEKLSGLLAKPASGSSWARDVRTAVRRVDKALEKTAEQRAQKKIQQSSQLGHALATLEKEIVVNDELAKIRSEFTAAKYANHPNWQRVQRVFADAKKSLLEEIAAARRVSPEEKRKLREKLEKATLSLPTSFRLVGAVKMVQDEACDRNMLNAFYRGSANQLTVCAGIMNSMPSESALFFVLAHELSHAITLPAQRDDAFDASPVAWSLDKLIASDGNAFRCDEWQRISAEVFRAPADFRKMPDSFDYLAECIALSSGSKHEPTFAASFADPKPNTPAWKDEVQRRLHARELAWDLARPDRAATYLSPATLVRREIPKELKRQELLAVDGPFPVRDQRSYAEQFLFAQALRCTPGFVAGKKLSPQVFENALTEASLVHRNLKRYEHAFKNRESFGRKRGIEKSTSENMADWFAARGLARHLRGLPEASRAPAAVAASSFFCKDPKLHPDEIAKALLVVGYLSIFERDALKNAMNDDHSSSGERGSGMLMGEVRRTASCEKSPYDEISYFSCDL